MTQTEPTNPTRPVDHSPSPDQPGVQRDRSEIHQADPTISTTIPKGEHMPDQAMTEGSTPVDNPSDRDETPTDNTSPSAENIPTGNNNPSGDEAPSKNGSLPDEEWNKPEFLTNSETQTVAKSINEYLSDLRNLGREPPNLSIATAYFNPGGFDAIADSLENVGHVRLLLGAEPAPPERVRKLSQHDSPSDRLKNLVRTGVEAHSNQIEIDRDLLGFTSNAHSNARRLVDWLRSGKVEVRRYEDGFLHGKAFIVEEREGAIAGSSNFTKGGMLTNLELNLGQYNPTTVIKVKGWFDGLWEKSVEFPLADYYAGLFEEYTPYLIYLRMLFERYIHELRAEIGPDMQIRPTRFQIDGIWRAKKILEDYNGVIVADGVGLGKSYIAASLIEEAIKKNRQRVLLIAPAALRDGMWENFLHNNFLGDCEVVSFEQLSADKKLNGDSHHLKSSLHEYSLVIVDEGHAYRNTGTKRSAALRKLLAGSPTKDIVFLTATPVNNSLNDLYQLLSYFIKNDAAFSSKGVTSLKRHFQEALSQNPEDLSPDHLFEIIDAITVRRTRHFVSKYYPNETIKDEEDNFVTIVFPKPTAKAVHYKFERLDEFFDKLAAALGSTDDDGSETSVDNSDQAQASSDSTAKSRIVDTDITSNEQISYPKLTLARYNPSRYLYENQIPLGVTEQEFKAQKAREITFDGLLRSALLKRFESSVYAFKRTCEKMIKSNEQFLEFLKAGRLVNSKVLDDWISTDSDDIDDFISDYEGETTDLKDYDTEWFMKDVESDIRELKNFHYEIDGITAAEDPKLGALVRELKEIAKQASDDGIDEQGVRNNRKVIIFSFYADTVHWIKNYLNSVIQDDPELADYLDRLTWLTGGSRGKQDVVANFAPISTGNKDVDDLYDIIVTTDVLAEGVNLQQARHIINYDLPWNPMRIVQRNGRIDRIGSKHSKVYIRCFFPDKNVDKLLNLIDKLHHKIYQAAASVGVDEEILPGSRVDPKVFSQTREEIEALRNENSEIHETRAEKSAYSGEEYRQELRLGIDKHGEDTISAMPWGSGSGKYVPGDKDGYVFCAKVGDSKQPLYRYVDASGPETEINGDVLTCFSWAQCEQAEPRVLSVEMMTGAYPAWERARNDILEWWIKNTDPASHQPNIPKAIREAVGILRDPRTGLTSDHTHNLIDILEAPYETRIRTMVRKLVEEYRHDPRAFARNIDHLVREEGMTKPEAAPAFPLIDIDDIHLICWMAITCKPENTPNADAIPAKASASANI